MKIATLFQAVALEELNSGSKSQDTTTTTPEAASMVERSKLLQASPSCPWQHQQSASNLHPSSPGSQSEGSIEQQDQVLQQQLTAVGETGLLGPTDLLLLDNVGSKGPEGRELMQQQQPLEKQISDVLQEQQPRQQAEVISEQLQQEVAAWCWISSYGHLLGSGPHVELLRETAASGQEESASWDVLVVSHGVILCLDYVRTWDQAGREGTSLGWIGNCLNLGRATSGELFSGSFTDTSLDGQSA
jgi:hypothetical protein